MPLYIVYRMAHALVLILPLRFSYWLGSRIADLHYYTSKKDRDLLVNNLKIVLGRDDKHARRIARAVIRNFAKYLVEFLRFSRMGKEYIEKHVKIEGIENIKRALELNKGLILFSGHLGNWEWGAAILAQLGYPINAIVLTHKDKNVNNFFTNQRAIKGVKNIPLGGSVRKSLGLLARNEAVCILSDRDFSNNSVTAMFFDRPASMPIGVAVFAIKTGCPTVPCFIVREKDDTHKFIIEKPMEYNTTGDNKRDIKDITQNVTGIIEKYIKLYPEQWFMFDNPWKATFS